ncbi:efflux RND transporter periplasmic adaptor subunit [Novipirellula herctigrandis]|uniref:efflux RND transporter periplasmic adaptor subunit n=1 Tax=Novipirellula herctigrandis TaxID=2527986 RepID=UPI003AF384ED
MSCSPATEIQGFTEPYQDIDVAASEMGIVEAIHIKEGDRVTENQLLVQMDDSVLEVTLEIAKSIKQSRGRLESAMEDLHQQTITVKKLNELIARKHASSQELDRAESKRRIAQANLKAIQEELQVKTLEYERTLVQLEKRCLRSPIDGVVTRVLRDCGESVLPSDPVIVRVVQLDPLLVIFLVPADLARELSVGRAVNVRFMDPTHMASGSIEFVSPTIDPQSGTTRVRVRLPNPDERLHCGTTCYLDFADTYSPLAAKHP